MFKVAGALLDRYWPIAISLAGAVALALFGTVWQDADETIGSLLTIVLIATSGVASVFSGVYMAIGRELRTQKTEADLMTVLRSTIIPLAEQFIAVKKPMVGEALENMATELTLQCRALVKDKRAVCDVNVYRLVKGGLERVNRASRAARQSFKRTSQQTPAAIEARCTVERIVAGKSTFCPDVQKTKWQRMFSLEQRKRDYRSFISVPVLGPGGKAIGMLSINSNKTKTLTELHQSYLQAAARIYAKAVEVR